MDFNYQSDKKYDIKKYFIGYFDILGFENKVKINNKEDDLALLTTIDEIIIFSRKSISTLYKYDIKMKVFSDNFLFCSEENYIPLILIIGMIQALFITNDLFIRGSLCYGDLYYDDEFIYGKGLINAYKLESKLAIFPRIIIDNSFFSGVTNITNKSIQEKISSNNILSNLQDIYCNDFDNYRFIDYLTIMKNYKDKESIDHPNETMSFFKFISDHAKYIKNNLLVEDTIENRIIKQKYYWCKNYHNEFCKKNKYHELIIS